MKNLKITPPRSVASILCNYMLGVVGLTGITHEPGRGMPADTVSVDRQDLVLSFTGEPASGREWPKLGRRSHEAVRQYAPHPSRSYAR